MDIVKASEHAKTLATWDWLWDNSNCFSVAWIALYSWHFEKIPCDFNCFMMDLTREGRSGWDLGPFFFVFYVSVAECLWVRTVLLCTQMRVREREKCHCLGGEEYLRAK